MTNLQARVQALLNQARSLTVQATLRRKGRASDVHHRRLFLMRQMLAMLPVN